MVTRELQAADGSAYRALCLAVVDRSPQFVAASAEEVSAWTDQEMAESLVRFSADPNSFVVGAFDSEGRLRAAIKCLHHTASNWRHKCTLYGLLFVDDFGAARDVILAATERCRQMPGVEIIQARSSVEMPRLCELLLELGFCQYGVEPRSLKVCNAYHDEAMFSLPSS